MKNNTKWSGTIYNFLFDEWCICWRAASESLFRYHVAQLSVTNPIHSIVSMFISCIWRSLVFIIHYPYLREESPLPSKKMSHGDEVQAWQKKHTNEGLSGPAQIIPRNAETFVFRIYCNARSFYRTLWHALKAFTREWKF